MNVVFVVFGVFGLAEGFGLAEMVSNYAKVSVNNGARNLINDTRFNATTPATMTETVLPLSESNETDYEDFDDLTETDSRQSFDGSTILKYFNGLVSMLSLMNNFSGRPKPEVGQPRFQPDTVSKKFKNYQNDQQYQPIDNFPPYNPLTANSADSYSQNNMKTSYESDLEQYKQPMSEYMTQNEDSEPQNWNQEERYPVYQQSEWHQSGDSWNYHREPKPDYHDYLIENDHQVVDQDRESKRPYSYYFLGRKLWYIPLLFSVYFIIYVGALVLKSVARHKIQFPDKLWDLKDEHVGYGKHRMSRKLDQLTENYENAVENFKNKFM